MNEMISTPPTNSERDARGRFQSGNRGGPGRKIGSRRRLAESFIGDLQSDWRRHGAAVIAEVRRTEPGVYMRIVAALMPQEIEIGGPGDFTGAQSVDEVLDMLAAEFESPADLLALMDHVRELVERRLGDRARPLPAPQASRGA